MYLHLGKNKVVRKTDIVAICDLDNTTGSRITRDCLAAAEKSGAVVNVAEDLPKSFVVCTEDGKTTVYLSQLSPATLLRRSGTRFGEYEMSGLPQNRAFGRRQSVCCVK